MNIAICDDDLSFLEELYRAIETHSAHHDWVFHCVMFPSPESLLAANLSTVQLLFLDIEMPGINGLDVARQLRKRYDDLLLIFITGFIQYAPAGYEVEAFRYLLKTSLQDKLPTCLNDAWKQLYRKQESVQLETLDHFINMRIKDILYIEGTDRRHVIVHTNNTTTPIECRGQLHAYEARFSNNGFLRIQRSFLVNMAHIDDFRNYIAYLDNGVQLKVSKALYPTVYSDYLIWKGQSL